MHKFNTLKYGGGAVTLLPQHVAQRMVRHVSKRNGWNGIGRFGEEVQNHGHGWTGIAGDGVSRRVCCDNKDKFFHCHKSRRPDHSVGIDCGSFGRRKGSHCLERRKMFRHACGGRNHLLTEVAA